MPWVTTDSAPPPVDTAPTPATQFESPEYEGTLDYFKDLFSGSKRTQFPEMEEFGSVYNEEQLSPGGRDVLGSMSGIHSPEIEAGLRERFPAPDVDEAMRYFNTRKGLSRSQITSDPAAQLDILRKNIPGLETRPDRYGNIMVRAPGMKEFTYLNKPGASMRDLEELGAQSAVQFPLLAFSGSGGNALSRVLRAGSGLTASSVAEDVLAGQEGSEQGISPEKAALTGAVGVASAGVVEPLVGGIINTAKNVATTPINRIRGALNPEAEATRRLTGAAAEDFANTSAQYRMSPRAALAAQQRGQDVRAIDVGGETLRAEARRAANISPSARESLTNFVQDRFGSQNVRMGDFVRRLVARPTGRGPNVFLTREQLQDSARRATRPRYDAAYQRGARGVMTPELQQLSTAPAVQRAMRAAQQEMRNRVAAGRSTGALGPTGNPTLEFWDLTKRRLDDRIKTLKRSGANSEALDLDSLRVQLLQQLDRLIPEYRTARGTAESFFNARDALEAGEKFVAGRHNPEAARRALAGMTQEERDLFAEGFASELIRKVEGIGDRRSILNTINNTPQARERLNIALGPNRARAVEAFLRVEGLMDLARLALGNSTTVRQLLEAGVGGYGVLSGDPTAMGLAALSVGSRWAGQKIDRRVAEAVMRQLLSQDINTFMRGVRQVASTPLLNALRAFDERIAQLGIGRAVASREAGRAASETSSAAPVSAGTSGGPSTNPPPITPEGPSTPSIPELAPRLPNNQVNAPVEEQQASNEEINPAKAYELARVAIKNGLPRETIMEWLRRRKLDPSKLEA